MAHLNQITPLHISGGLFSPDESRRRRLEKLKPRINLSKLCYTSEQKVFLQQDIFLIDVNFSPYDWPRILISTLDRQIRRTISRRLINVPSKRFIFVRIIIVSSEEAKLHRTDGKVPKSYHGHEIIMPRYQKRIENMRSSPDCNRVHYSVDLHISASGYIRRQQADIQFFIGTKKNSNTGLNRDLPNVRDQTSES